MKRRELIALPAALTLNGIATNNAFARATLNAQAAPEKPVPPVLKGMSLDSKPFTLEQELGKVVMVTFWATWCPTCRAEMPELRANYEGWRSKGFNLVTVSIDDSMRDIEQYDKLIQQTVPVKQQFPRLWRGQPGLVDNFGRVRGTPTHFLLNKKGELVQRYQGRLKPQVWDDIAALVLA
jgi:cytochrome c biogenesis protein CcmG, thiol:disulfide interchange protein DsbE